jgi:hypothetical protein
LPIIRWQRFVGDEVPKAAEFAEPTACVMERRTACSSRHERHVMTSLQFAIGAAHALPSNVGHCVTLPQPYDASDASSPVPHALSAPPHAPRICVASRVRYALIFMTVPDSAEQSVLAASWPFKRMS